MFILALMADLMLILAFATLVAQRPGFFFQFVVIAVMIKLALHVDRSLGSQLDADTLEIVRRVLAEHEGPGMVTAPTGGMLIHPRHDRLDSATPES